VIRSEPRVSLILFAGLSLSCLVILLSRLKSQVELEPVGAKKEEAFHGNLPINPGRGTCRHVFRHFLRSNASKPRGSGMHDVARAPSTERFCLQNDLCRCDIVDGRTARPSLSKERERSRDPQPGAIVLQSITLPEDAVNGCGGQHEPGRFTSHRLANASSGTIRSYLTTIVTGGDLLP
jgi:hypothetical protein